MHWSFSQILHLSPGQEPSAAAGMAAMFLLHNVSICPLILLVLSWLTKYKVCVYPFKFVYSINRTGLEMKKSKEYFCIQIQSRDSGLISELNGEDVGDLNGAPTLTPPPCLFCRWWISSSFSPSEVPILVSFSASSTICLYIRVRK